ncbi:MAG: hypothetical protein SOT42_00160 [Eubacteriales bacterium]|nr:hypothetical protein [Eubacteriales bacterium]
MKNKTKGIWLWLLGGLTGVLGAFLCTRFAADSPALGEYLTTELMPAVTMALSAAGTAFVAAWPLLGRLGAAGDAFRSAQREIEKSNAESRLSGVRYENAGREVSALRGELSALSGELAQCRATLAVLSRMVTIGFCSQEELVRGGFAGEIAALAQKCAADDPAADIPAAKAPAYADAAAPSSGGDPAAGAPAGDFPAAGDKAGGNNTETQVNTPQTGEENELFTEGRT